MKPTKIFSQRLMDLLDPWGREDPLFAKLPEILGPVGSRKVDV